MMTAAEPFLLPKKKLKTKSVRIFHPGDFGFLSYLLLCACFFVNSRLEPPQPYQWKKNKTFMAALAVKNKTNPDPRAYPLIIAVIS